MSYFSYTELAEKQVIGAILLGTKEAEMLFTMLSEVDFFYPGHREIFSAAKKEFDQTGQYEVAKLYALPAALQFVQDGDYTIAMGDLLSFARQVKTQARDRRLKQALSELLAKEDEYLLPGLQKLVDREQATGATDCKSLVEQQMEQVLGEMEGNLEVKRISTGFQHLNFITGGLRQGNISTWGAKPSTGKTTLLLNVLLHNAKLGKKTAFFSLEMSTTQLWERILSNACNLDYGAINRHKLDEAQKREYRNRLIELSKGGNILLLDNCFTIEDQASFLYELKPDFVVVDYIQLVRTMQKCANRNDELGYIIARYKQLARKLDCHISLLSQFNRSGTAGREDGLSMFQLKDSGSIEDGSDYVFLLSRPAVDDPAEPAEETRIKLQKNKFGIVGVCSLYFDGSHQRFTGVSGRQDRPWPERADIDG